MKMDYIMVSMEPEGNKFTRLQELLQQVPLPTGVTLQRQVQVPLVSYVPFLPPASFAPLVPLAPFVRLAHLARPAPFTPVTR